MGEVDLFPPTIDLGNLCDSRWWLTGVEEIDGSKENSTLGYIRIEMEIPDPDGKLTGKFYPDGNLQVPTIVNVNINEKHPNQEFIVTHVDSEDHLVFLTIVTVAERKIEL